MKKLRIAICLLYSICFIDQSLGSCNCNASSASKISEPQNNKPKIMSNNASQTEKSTKLPKAQQEKLKEEKQLKKELQELQEFLEQSKKENSEKTKNSK